MRRKSDRLLVFTSQPDELTDIGQYAFEGRIRLTENTINRSTPSTAGTEIFKNCTNLTKIKMAELLRGNLKTIRAYLLSDREPENEHTFAAARL